MYTELEWQIMRSVWQNQPTTSRDIIQDLSSQRETSPATIKTMLHRLVDKEALRFRRKGNRYLYSARCSQAESVTEACGQLVQIVFDGQPAAAIAFLASSSNLSRHQAEYLQELLADIEDACQQSEQREARQVAAAAPASRYRVAAT